MMEAQCHICGAALGRLRCALMIAGNLLAGVGLGWTALRLIDISSRLCDANPKQRALLGGFLLFFAALGLVQVVRARRSRRENPAG